MMILALIVHIILRNEFYNRIQQNWYHDVYNKKLSYRNNSARCGCRNPQL